MDVRLRRGALCLLVVLAGCSGDEPPEPAATSTAPAPTAPAPTATGTSPATEVATTEGIAAVLGAEWEQDGNDDGIPDPLEEELGHDPDVDTCALEIDCPGIESLADLEGLAVQQSSMLLLDASGSMAAAGPDGSTKMDQARDALERYVVGTPETVDLGFLVYGHRGTNEPSGKAESCAGAEVLSGLGEVDPDTFRGVPDSFQPTGYTPIATSLQRAGEEFAGREGHENRVILVTDGIETCDGDPVGAARTLRESGIEVTVDVVGFDIDPAETPALRELAEAGRGSYTDARSGDDLDAYFEEERNELFEVGGRISCLTDARGRAGGCEANRFLDAGFRLNELANEARGDGDTAAADAYVDLAGVLTERNIERNEETTRLFEQELQPLVEAFEEAQRRLRERYGEQVSLDCRPPATGRLDRRAARVT